MCLNMFTVQNDCCKLNRKRMKKKEVTKEIISMGAKICYAPPASMQCNIYSTASHSPKLYPYTFLYIILAYPQAPAIIFPLLRSIN